MVDKRCVILVDDRGENIAAAHRAGFGVLQVSDERGVSMAAAAGIKAPRSVDGPSLGLIRPSGSSRGGSWGSSHWPWRRPDAIDATVFDTIDATSTRRRRGRGRLCVCLRLCVTSRPHLPPAVSVPSPRPKLWRMPSFRRRRGFCGPSPVPHVHFGIVPC